MRLRALLLCLLSSAAAFAQKPVKNIELRHLTKSYYVCVSYGYPPDSDEPFPANSLVVVTNKGIILVNTPWGEEQTQQLVDSVKHRFNKKIIFCVATHFHDDCVAGFNVLKKQGAKTYSSKHTYALAKKENNELPQYTFAHDTTFNIAGVSLQTYYPGAGHTRDNIVVWLPQAHVLFGGCLVKSLDASTKGFTGDADLKHWPLAIQNVARKFPAAQYVIPGHQGWQGGINQLGHTRQLILKVD
ncbi:subclass B1 metallo-beta-lactamase [Mucilaginibacter phyllosphaerae]|uniref:beta-lactamase n=1 Tax=Mucilaginibacter phyllosphaerae TaxID=1812349 RepID=A0A4Y8AKI3_9SPHI|nr:subclass B1 metallo-beta-lactamase [Mucilaginibacter phyllosphaerae]MBB3967926.1 metallo-beta-lactamase class B [Mucilaginibacter phyllosphaerae]TEW69035.1 subclass B1 metallo-beta-lactamase [Mucilaginibacter phyllosphaerae]GGH02362.1 beta-lactamase [Mucilaginibacter phyllosphaerae]